MLVGGRRWRGWLSWRMGIIRPVHGIGRLLWVWGVGNCKSVNLEIESAWDILMNAGYQIGFALAGVAEEYEGMTQIGNIALEYMFS